MHAQVLLRDTLPPHRPGGFHSPSREATGSLSPAGLLHDTAPSALCEGGRPEPREAPELFLPALVSSQCLATAKYLPTPLSANGGPWRMRASPTVASLASGRFLFLFVMLGKTTVLLLWPSDFRVRSVLEGFLVPGGQETSPLFLFGALRQGLQVELQHVPSIFVSAEVPLGIKKKHPR